MDTHHGLEWIYTPRKGEAMKVRISLTVEVDAEGWDMDYGTGTSAKAVREDVQAWVVNTILQSNDNLTAV